MFDNGDFFEELVIAEVYSELCKMNKIERITKKDKSR